MFIQTMPSLSSTLKQEFKKNKLLTNQQIYAKILPMDKSGDDPTKIKHRIRAVLNNMRSRNEIVRVGDSTYRWTGDIDG